MSSMVTIGNNSKTRSEIQDFDDDDDDDLEDSEEISKSPFKKAYNNFFRVYNNGYEQLTNVVVGLIQEEKQVREKEQKIRLTKHEELQKSSENANLQFQKSLERWINREEKLPLEIYNLMQKEKNNCQLILKGVNCEIDKLQFLIEQREKWYEEEFDKLTANLLYLIKKSEHLINDLFKLSKDGIQTFIDFSIEESHRKSEDYFNEWKKMCGEVRNQRISHQENLEKRRNEYEKEKQIEDDLWSEECTYLRKNLLDDIQTLTIEMRKIKMFCLVNQVKLEYNIEILQKKSEEWNKLISEQKRELVHLNKKSKQLQDRLKMLQIEQKTKFLQAQKDYSNLTEKLKKSEQKWEYLNFIENKKYVDIFILRMDELKELSSKVLEADKIIHNNVLGVEWQKPNIEESQTSTSSYSDLENSNFQWKFSLFNAIFEEMNYLIKDKSLFQKGISLIKLDTILNSLGIKTLADFENFYKYFQKHRKYETDNETILNIIKEFLQNRSNPKKNNQKKVHKTVKMENWKECINLLSEDRLFLWDSLYEMQKKYYDQVKRRSQLLKLKNDLIIKNNELKKVINNYKNPIKKL